MNKAAEIFFNNPYSVLGVSCVADNLEIVKAQEKIEKLAKLGAEKSYKTKYTSNNFPSIDRSSGIVQTAISNIDNPVHKLFWFSNSAVIENYDSTLQMIRILDEPDQIEYDVFLLEYIDLICNDSSCSQIDRWKKLFRVISWYLNNSSEISNFLASRKLENAELLFSENILNPILEICSQTEFEIGIKLLNTLKDINSEETLSVQFKELENDIIDSIIEQLETMISNKTSFAEGINLNSTISSETINLANQTAKDIKNICQTYLDSLLSIADPVSCDRIKDMIYANFNICVNVLLANFNFKKIKAFLPTMKKYSPSSQRENISEIVKTINELSSYEATIQRKKDNYELDSQDLNLLNHKDIQVKMLAYRAFGGDLESVLVLGNIFNTKTHERKIPIDIPYNPSKGVQLLEYAANKGNDTAKVYLGMCYLVGNGVSQSVTKARKYIEDASNNGNKDARELMKDYRVRAIFDQNKEESVKGIGCLIWGIVMAIGIIIAYASGM